MYLDYDKIPQPARNVARMAEAKCGLCRSM
jgi:hypothetical protein